MKNRTVADDPRILFECAGHTGAYNEGCMYCEVANGIRGCALGISEDFCNSSCAWHPKNNMKAGFNK